MLGLCYRMAFSQVAMSGGYSRIAVLTLLMAVASLALEHGLWGVVFSSCGWRALEHRLNSYGPRA